MSMSDSPAMNKKDSTVKKRGAAPNKKKYIMKKKKRDTTKKKRDTTKKSEVMTKKKKLDGGVHGGPHRFGTAREKLHLLLRSRVAMIEQGKNDLGEKLGPSRKRNGEKKYCVVQIKRDEMIEWLRMHFHQMQYNMDDPMAVIEEGRNDHAVEIKSEEREGNIDVIVWLKLNRRQDDLTAMVDISLMAFS
ncbi:hypothetical protein YC2023_028030 [Brassica napus]